MNVGFVVAMESEYVPFLSKLGKFVDSEVLAGIEFCKYELYDRTIFLAKCGIGEIASSAATALLIGRFGCRYIVNFGLVGSLDGASCGEIALVRDVVHYDCDITAFGHQLGAPADIDDPFILADQKMVRSLERFKLPVLRLASGDKFVADPALNSKIKTDFSANICDMEGAGVALTCARAHVPFTMIKLVSDGANDNATEDFKLAKERTFGRAFDIVLAVIREA